MLAAGSTFLVPSGPAEFLHLNIVCIGERAAPDMRLLVPISSIKPDKAYDPACVIDAGEHEFILHPSFVAYRHAQQRSASKILECIRTGTFVAKPALRVDILDRIIRGFDRSEFAAPWALKLLGR